MMQDWLGRLYTPSDWYSTYLYLPTYYWNKKILLCKNTRCGKCVVLKDFILGTKSPSSPFTAHTTLIVAWTMNKNEWKACYLAAWALYYNVTVYITYNTWQNKATLKSTFFNNNFALTRLRRPFCKNIILIYWHTLLKTYT